LEERFFGYSIDFEIDFYFSDFLPEFQIFPRTKSRIAHRLKYSVILKWFLKLARYRGRLSLDIIFKVARFDRVWRNVQNRYKVWNWFTKVADFTSFRNSWNLSKKFEEKFWFVGMDFFWMPKWNDDCFKILKVGSKEWEIDSHREVTKETFRQRECEKESWKDRGTEETDEGMDRQKRLYGHRYAQSIKLFFYKIKIYRNRERLIKTKDSASKYTKKEKQRENIWTKFKVCLIRQSMKFIRTRGNRKERVYLKKNKERRSKGHLNKQTENKVMNKETEKKVINKDSSIVIECHSLDRERENNWRKNKRLTKTKEQQRRDTEVEEIQR